MLRYDDLIMIKYQVIDKPAILFSGLLELNEDQVRRRRHLLELVEGSIYMIVKPVTFKVGEVFGYDGEINKATALALVDAVLAETQEVTEEKPKKESFFISLDYVE